MQLVRSWNYDNNMEIQVLEKKRREKIPEDRKTVEIYFRKLSLKNVKDI